MARRRLHISRSLSLALDAATETFWFSGKRGSGKTHNCTVLIEELLKNGVQVVILDPVRAWYGLRSSVDGKHAGIPILICGGPHGDMPLNPLGGALMAEFAVREGVSMILDMKEWSKGQVARFVRDFLLRLLQINEEAMHVVFEEAPRFAPQNPAKGLDTAEMLGACIDFVQTGRGMGLGGSLVSQRSANLNTNVRSQTSVLVAHKANYKLDIDAMNDWFVYHESPLAQTVKTRIPHLPVGTALMASIELFGDEDSLHEVVFRPRETFDSSSTPKVGERKRVAKTFAEIDITAISAEMTSMIEEAKANDPKELKAEVERLRQQIAALEARPAQVEVETKVFEKTFEVEIIPEWVRKALGELMTDAYDIESIGTRSTANANALQRTLDEWTPQRTEVGTTERTEQPSITAKVQVADASKVDTPKATARPVRALGGTWDGRKLGKCERSILTALAKHGAGPQKRTATFAGYLNNKAFANSVSALRQAGLLVGTQAHLELTPAGGEAVAGQYEDLPSGDALYQHWLSDRRIGKCERAILEALRKTYPRPVDTVTIAELTDGEYEPNKAFSNSVSKVRTLELIEGRESTGGMKLRDELMGA